MSEDQLDDSGGSPRRVLLVIHALSRGGAERALSGLANHFAARGDQVALLTLDPARVDSYVIHPSVQRITLGDEHAGERGSRLVALRRTLRSWGPDIVISFIDRMNVIVLAAMLTSPVPVIVSERVDPRRHRPDTLTRLLRPALYQRANTVVVQTEGAARFLRRWRIRPIAIIPNWVSPLFVPVDRPDRHPVTILAAGRLTPQKGFDLLLDALGTVEMSDLDWVLTIFGDGPERARLAAQAALLGIADRLTLPGETDRLQAEMADADMFVLPSRYEGFPNVLLEAMATGIAVVSFACDSGPAEIVTSELDGILVPPEDVTALSRTLARVVVDGDLRARLGAAATGVRAKWSEPAIAAKWDELVDGVVASRRRTRGPRR